MSLLYKHIHFFLLCSLIIFITFIYRFPDVYAYFTTPPDMIFLGQNAWFDPQDITIYASVIHYTQLGHFFLPNIWTALPNQPILIFPVEQVLGYIFRSVPPYFLFWIASIICGILLIVVIYYLLRRYIASELLTAATTLAIALGGGFGFLLYPNIASSDIVNGITFYETFAKPHEALSIAGYVYGMVTFYEVFITASKRDYKKISLISLAFVISFLLYPYLFALYIITTVPFLLFSKIKITIKECALVFLLPVIPVTFVAYQLSQNTGFQAPFLQHLATDPLATFFGFGLLLPIFIYQLLFMKKTKFIKYLSWWIVSALLLSFLPFGPGKIFLRGLFFPLVLVCVLQLQSLIKHLSSVSLRRFFLIVFFIFTCLTSCYIFYLRMTVIQAIDAVGVIYLPKEDYTMFTYINNHITPGNGILAGRMMSNLIPAYTHERSCIGSLWSFNSIYATQLHHVDRFYAGQPITKTYLRDNHVSYVLWASSEQEITNSNAGHDIQDLRELYHNLKLVYRTNTSNLYQVQ